MGGRCSRLQTPKSAKIPTDVQDEWNGRFAALLHTSCLYYDRDQYANGIALLSYCLQNVSFSLDFEYLHFRLLPSISDDLRATVSLPLWTLVAEYACALPTRFIEEKLSLLHCSIAHCYTALADTQHSYYGQHLDSDRLASFHAKRALALPNKLDNTNLAALYMYRAISEHHQALSMAKSKDDIAAYDQDAGIAALHSVTMSIGLNANDSFTQQLKGEIFVWFKLYSQALHCFATVVSLGQSRDFIKRALKWTSRVHVLMERHSSAVQDPRAVIKTWTSARTAHAVRSIGEPYRPYADRLMYHAVDGATFSQMTDQHLVTLGVSNSIHRLRLLSLIQDGS